MAAPQGHDNNPSIPSAPYGSDLPPPYSAVVSQPNNGDVSGTGYPQIGFVAGPPPKVYPQSDLNTQSAGAYPHSGGAYPHPQTTGGYPHPPSTGVYPHPQSSGAYPHQQSTGVMIAQIPGGAGHVNVIVAPPVGTDPVNMYCPSCAQQITSKVDYRTSWHTHLIAGIVCFSTMFFSMCCLGLVPYCLDSCKNAEHTCPNCNAYLGKYERC